MVWCWCLVIGIVKKKDNGCPLITRIACNLHFFVPFKFKIILANLSLLCHFCKAK
jgi:hypothetical protein